MDSAKLASVLGIPEEAADIVGPRVAVAAFAQKLASVGIVAESDQELMNLYNHATALDNLTTGQQNQKQASIVDSALGMIAQAAQKQAAYGGPMADEQAQLAYEVGAKTAEFMEDPSVFAASLLDISRSTSPEVTK